MLFIKDQSIIWSKLKRSNRSRAGRQTCPGHMLPATRLAAAAAVPTKRRRGRSPLTNSFLWRQPAKPRSQASLRWAPKSCIQGTGKLTPRAPSALADKEIPQADKTDYQQRKARKTGHPRRGVCSCSPFALRERTLVFAALCICLSLFSMPCTSTATPLSPTRLSHDVKQPFKLSKGVVK